LSALIVDASVAAKWFIPEEHRDAALLALAESNQLHAPDFLLLEIDNTICKWIRQGIIDSYEGSDLREALRDYPIRFYPFKPLLDSAYAVANQTGRSVYDSLYVALAAVLGIPLVTADKKHYVALKDSPFKKHVMWVEELG